MLPLFWTIFVYSLHTDIDVQGQLYPNRGKFRVEPGLNKHVPYHVYLIHMGVHSIEKIVPKREVGNFSRIIYSALSTKATLRSICNRTGGPESKLITESTV